jgi:DNA-binding CsgD family transcriptional regulator
MLSRQGPGKVRTALLEERCLALRLEGLTHREIASRLGIAPSTAYKRVSHALQAVNERNAAEAERLRALELLRLDALQDAIWEKALEGEAQSLTRVLAIMERRAKLLGLDAPTSAKRELPLSPQGLRLKREAMVRQIAAECCAEGSE